MLTAITIPSGVTIDEVSVSDGRRKTGSTCIRLSDGVVHCWGLGTNGDLGDGTIVNRPTPGPVSATEFAGNKPVDLVAGHSIRCARMDNGDVYCWGENRGGVVGNGGMLDADFPLPQRVSLTGVTQVDASHHTACAIDGAKQLYCWGANRSGNATARYPMSLAEDTITLPFHIVF